MSGTNLFNPGPGLFSPLSASQITRVQRTANQSITSATWTAVSWDTEVVDDGGWWNSGTATRITPGAGIFAFMVMCAWNSNSSGFRYARVIQYNSSNTLVEQFDGIPASGGEHPHGWAAVTGQVKAAAGDYFIVEVYTTGSTLNFGNNATSGIAKPHFTMVSLNSGGSGGSGGGGTYSEVAPVTITSNTTADVVKHTYLADATSGAVTLTLPTAVGRAGKVYILKKIDSSANVVTLDGNASETIDGQTTLDTSTQNDMVAVESDGSNWQTIVPSTGGGSDTPESVTLVTFQNSWVDSNPTDYNQAGYYKHDGRVWFQGIIQGGTSGTQPFALPAGYRPPKYVILPAWSGTDGVNYFQFFPDGTSQGIRVGTSLSLEGLSFRHA